MLDNYTILVLPLSVPILSVNMVLLTDVVCGRVWVMAEVEVVVTAPGPVLTDVVCGLVWVTAEVEVVVVAAPIKALIA